jgi:hypothetical protein
MTNSTRVLTACVLAAAALECPADNFTVHRDTAGDAALRRTDNGADGAINPAAVLPDLLAVTYGRWSPFNPVASLYDGEYLDDSAVNFFRVDLELAGCVNPPGSLGLGGDFYDPFLFGPSPLYGHIEFDVDEEPDSGGELGGTAALRYMANAARFGSLPTGTDHDDFPIDRVVTLGSQIDFDFNTVPQYERSGADFTLVLCGCFVPSVVSEGGDGDSLFEPGETWVVGGRFFERFQGFRPASGLFGGSDLGLWDPIVKLRFSHSIETDITTVSLVVPLNQAGAGQMVGAAAQPMDFNVANQTSLAEAINDLAVQSSSISGAVRTLALPWKSAIPSDYFDASDWDVTVALATAHLEPESSLYAWTDIGFEDIVGDFDSANGLSAEDRTELESIVYDLDATAADADGSLNGIVGLASFGPNFSMYDTNYDGCISNRDWPPGNADVNADTMVDILDLLDFLDAFAICEGSPGPCIVNGVNTDFDLNTGVDILDFLDFVEAFGG